MGIPFRTLQAVHSLTFKPPPHDGSYNLLDILDFHAENSTNHPLFRYIDDDSVKTINWGDAVHAARVASTIVQTRVQGKRDGSTVAILAVLDPITYWILILGIMHAGYTPFPISIRNSDIAVAHLLESTNAKHVFVSPDAVMQNLAVSACKQLNSQLDATDEGYAKALETPVFGDFFKPGSIEAATPKHIVIDDIALSLHSSGTSSFPKAIKISHRSLLEWGLSTYFSDRDVCGEVVSILGYPMFRGLSPLSGYKTYSTLLVIDMAGVCQIMNTAMTGIIVAVFPPQDMPVVPTPENVLEGAVRLRCTILSTVPSMLEAWAKDPSKVEALKSFTSGYGGGPLSPIVGDMLVQEGVSLIAIYAMTEAGIISNFFLKQPPVEGWEYITGTNDVFRLIFKHSEMHTPSISNTVIDGQPAFDTKDLLRRHPHNHNLFKIYGRADEQIMHSTNPVPIELILRKDEKIETVIMFGRSKFQAGVLVLPSKDFAFDPSDLTKLAEFRNAIWETVQCANEFAPQHSKILKELIVVTNPSKPVYFTAKGTTRRQFTLDAYEDEIEAAYQAFEESSQHGIRAPSIWDTVVILLFVREVVNNVLGFEVQDDVQLFRVGADSLAATYIRNTITRALRDSKIVPLAAVRALPANFVYDHPSISALSDFVYDIPRNFRDHCLSGREDGEDEEETEGFYQWPKLAQEGETILQIRKGNGEPPLMVIHGGDGGVGSFIHFQQRFRSALWLVQVTPDLRRNTLREHAQQYYVKIKEIRPHGPYRLAAYSGSHLIAFLIAEMILKDGEDVTQMALIDHSPSFMFGIKGAISASDSEEFDIKDKSFRDAYKERMIQSLYDAATREGRTQILEVFRDAWQGRPAPETYIQIAETMKHYADECLDFIASFPVYGRQEGHVRERILKTLEDWLRTINVPVSLYVASRGVIGSLDGEEKEKWMDLGIRRCFASAKVIHVDDGHVSVLSNEVLITGLQEGYI
ncbi:hypothetical protein D9758_008985 [Tetrapyrgos nigripes]|uniref:Polyketide synthase-like phosphopantetheine-binding domain-containing protein n=1 Tax=Tetrapyrgos nigripes TaxID=182062 RepID=A0A8H5GKP7_9AGAR|nr:hypothetical protein D9758_008985 [Tetrapyrgos nigripes]